MFRENPEIAALRDDPEVRAFAQTEAERSGRPVDVDLALIDAYIKYAKAKFPGDAKVQDMAEKYLKAIENTLEYKQAGTAEDQLRQSSVLNDRPIFGTIKAQRLFRLQRGR